MNKVENWCRVGQKEKEWRKEGTGKIGVGLWSSSRIQSYLKQQSDYENNGRSVECSPSLYIFLRATWLWSSSWSFWNSIFCIQHLDLWNGHWTLVCIVCHDTVFNLGFIRSTSNAEHFRRIMISFMAWLKRKINRSWWCVVLPHPPRHSPTTITVTSGATPSFAAPHRWLKTLPTTRCYLQLKMSYYANWENGKSQQRYSTYQIQWTLNMLIKHHIIFRLSVPHGMNCTPANMLSFFWWRKVWLTQRTHIGSQIDQIFINSNRNICQTSQANQ